MTFDTTVNLPTLVTFVGAVLGFVIWLIRLEARVSSTGSDLHDLHAQVGAITALVSLNKEQFHEYQLQVAREYVSNAVIAEIKRDIITELGRMESRVETQIDRLVEAQRQ